MAEEKMTQEKAEKFDQEVHMINVKGKKYLEVKWRVYWFRLERPLWAIETEPMLIEKSQAIFRAFIKNEQSRTIAVATGSETPGDFGDYIEKAETKAIGRALALCGYGTQFAPELEEGERIVDSPVDFPKKTKTNKNAQNPTPIEGEKISSQQSSDLYNKMKIMGWSDQQIRDFLMQEVNKKYTNQVGTKELPVLLMKLDGLATKGA